MANKVTGVMTLSDPRHPEAPMTVPHRELKVWFTSAAIGSVP
jgi:hypothetical protein